MPVWQNLSLFRNIMVKILEDLYSLLLQSSKPTHLILKGTAMLKENLGTYGVSLLQTLTEASVENGTFTVSFEE